MGKHFLLVEPVAKTPYPPVGLLKISTMLKRRHKDAKVFSQVGAGVPAGMVDPKEIYITSLFTWDLDKVVETARYYQRRFYNAKIKIGGIAASLLPEYIKANTGIKPHVGLLNKAEICPPDYSHTFGRKLNSSITFTSRGCIRKCRFCNVRSLEPEFFIKEDWEKDISLDLPVITFWDNNWLASPNFKSDCEKLFKIGKKVDFNQGLDARLYDEEKAKLLSKINLDPVRFAFDDIKQEDAVLKAIRIAKKYSDREIRIYVLYNFNDTPEDFYHRINLLNKEKVTAFPMEYRPPTEDKRRMPGKHWDTYLLRGVKLTLLFYYRRGTITLKRESFESIYGKTSKQFVSKMYDVYEYDKTVKTKPKDKIGGQ